MALSRSHVNYEVWPSEVALIPPLLAKQRIGKTAKTHMLAVISTQICEYIYLTVFLESIMLVCSFQHFQLIKVLLHWP